MAQSSISLRYQLQLHEFQEAFKVASFGQKGIMAWLTTIFATAMMLYGFYLGFDQGGKFFIIFGAVFSVLQLTIRFYLVPMMFKRQFIKNQLDQTLQGIDLDQQHFSYIINQKVQQFPYSAVHKSAEGHSCYVLELNTRASIIVPKRAFTSDEQQQQFKRQFKL